LASFRLCVAIESHDETVSIDGLRPSHSQICYKEVSSPSIRESSSASAVIARIIHRLRFGAGANRTGGQAATGSTDATVSKITQMAMHSKAEWAFYITDPLGSGMALSPDQLPRASFNSVGKIDISAPPPTHMDVEILSFWGIRDDPFRNMGKPTYSNICQIVDLEVPSNLRGSQVYNPQTSAYQESLMPRSRVAQGSF